VMHDLPSTSIEAWHVDGLALDQLSLHVHLMKNLLLQEMLRLDCLLLNRGVLHEFLPYFVRGQGPSLVKQLGNPEMCALAHVFISNDINDLSCSFIHFCDYNYYYKFNYYRASLAILII
jgi:hypothetical protein